MNSSSINPPASTLHQAFESIVTLIDLIQRNYSDMYDQTGEFKALQGMERCAEMKMKLYGFDGKQPTTPPLEAQSSISLADLPDELLQNLIIHLNNRKMQQHK